MLGLVLHLIWGFHVCNLKICTDDKKMWILNPQFVYMMQLG